MLPKRRVRPIKIPVIHWIDPSEAVVVELHSQDVLEGEQTACIIKQVISFVQVYTFAISLLQSDRAVLHDVTAYDHCFGLVVVVILCDCTDESSYLTEWVSVAGTNICVHRNLWHKCAKRSFVPKFGAVAVCWSNLSGLINEGKSVGVVWIDLLGQSCVVTLNPYQTCVCCTCSRDSVKRIVRDRNALAAIV